MTLAALVLTAVTFVVTDAANKAISYLASAFTYIGLQATADKPEYTLSILTVIVSTIALLLQITFLRPSAAARPTNEPSVSAFRQFLNGWKAIWVTWTLLYLWFCISAATGLDETHSLLYWSVADLLNVSNAFAFFYCFFIMDMPTIKLSTHPLRARQFEVYVFRIVLLGLFLCFASYLGRSGTVPALAMIGKMAVSAFTALSMAYLFGRLDSHYMSVPLLMLAPMYLYVIIQMLWYTFDSGASAVQTGAFALALLFKVLVFVAISKWLRSGNIARYLMEAERFYAGGSRLD